MWIFSEKGFVSLVQDRDDASKLQVRARVADDITDTFPGAELFTADGADYRYRARIDRREVADVMHRAVMGVNYDSHFKDVAIEASNHPGRWRAYYGVWTALAELQDYKPYSSVPRALEPRWDEDVDDDDEAHDSRWWR
ncbi:hypothetical protein H5398_03350 [Tessaracoccus sp. MC1679]|uniref:hypothetical protein n=1 Tax=Tessaracoccus sp. MC1679 TaxID=2760313 RepID=UPI0016007A69|nr:hypothetical protein [Tessaracoccus sp. MC1679]MBB1515015.1 hypothetical protein [Tessaracoccus sp. MC1679]